MSNITEISPEQQAPKVTIDNVEYDWNSLPEDVRNILAELSYVDERINELEVDVQRHRMMKQGYTVQLAEEMKKVQQ